MFVWHSLFLRTYGVAAALISFYALIHVGQGHWQWLGPLLAWGHLPLINAWRSHRANIAYLDEREKPAMTATLIGVALVLVGGDRGWELALTFAGLFGLLGYVFIATALPRGLREDVGTRERLAVLSFFDGARRLDLRSLNSEQPILVLVAHSVSSCYSRMALRELEEMVIQGQLPLQAEQCVVVFPDSVPAWAHSLSVLGVHCWSDPEGTSLTELGVWLRGGDWSFVGGRNAARPALALLPAGEHCPSLWFEANNLRVPPSIREHLAKISRGL